MRRIEISDRTKSFALRVIRLVGKLPRTRVGDILGRQVLRSATSIGANYREASRATTKRHFTSTLAIALRAADETLYWLELIAESNTIKPQLLMELIDECRQLVAILAASVKRARGSSS